MQRYLLTAALVLAFVLLLSFMSERRAPQRVVAGQVVDVQGGEWVAVANETTDPLGIRISLRGTGYGPPAGSRVTVWYRVVGERQPIADKLVVAN